MFPAVLRLRYRIASGPKIRITQVPLSILVQHPKPLYNSSSLPPNTQALFQISGLPLAGVHLKESGAPAGMSRQHEKVTIEQSRNVTLTGG